MRRDLVSGKLGKAPSRSIDDALQRWLEGEAAGLKSYNNLLSIVRAVVPFTKGKPLTAIVQVAEQMKSDYIKEGLAPATINRRLAVLRRIANLAHGQWEWLDLPLGGRIKLLSGEKHRHIYLTPEQVEELALKCRNPAVATVIRLAARTVLRENEILQAATIYDWYIVVEATTSKNQRPRLVPVPADMQDLTLPIGITYATLRTFFEDAREAA